MRAYVPSRRKSVVVIKCPNNTLNILVGQMADTPVVIRAATVAGCGGLTPLTVLLDFRFGGS